MNFTRPETTAPHGQGGDRVDELCKYLTRILKFRNQNFRIGWGLKCWIISDWGIIYSEIYSLGYVFWSISM